MAHYIALVLVPPDTSEILAEVEKLMAPHQQSEVPPYKERTDVSDWTDRQLADALASGYLDRDDEGYFWWRTDNPNGRWDYWLVGGLFNGALLGLRKPPSAEGSIELNTRPVASLLAQESPTWQHIRASALVTPDGSWADTFDFHGFDDPESYEQRWTNTWSAWDAHTIPILQQYQDHIAVALDVHS